MSKHPTYKSWSFWAFPTFWLGYLAIVTLTQPLRPEHFALVGFVCLLYFAHQKTRRWAIDFFPFALFGIIYDFLRIIPKSWAGPIHIAGPHQLEHLLFRSLGFSEDFIPTDFFLTHQHATLDIITGLLYGCHVFVPIGFALYLWAKGSEKFHSFLWAFFAMNMLAFVTYVFYPVAPPWYVSQFGYESLGWDVPATLSVAGLSRFDAFFGITYYTETYSRAAWVFGAVPSMHAAFPFMISLFARQILPRGKWLFYIYSAAIAFSAVYLNHHYVIDILAGWAYAGIAYTFVTFAFPLLTTETITVINKPLDSSEEGSVGAG